MSNVGRPSKYTPELADEICARLMEGNSLNSICAGDEFPAMRTVISWLAEDKHDFCAKYARAREIQAEVLADGLMDIANDGRNDLMAVNDKDGVGYRLNGEAVSRSKLRLEQARWNAEKLRPKKYGQKVSIGGDPENPLLGKNAANFTDDELAEIIQKRGIVKP